MSITSRLATAGWRLGARGAARRFATAVADPRAVQDALRSRAAERLAGTARGRELGIDPTRHASLEHWRAEVPVATYEDHRSWIDRIAAGEQDVLTPGGVRCLEPTGGTSGDDKLVPITAELLGEFNAATTPWVQDMLRSDPRLRGGRAYWAVSPPNRTQARTAGDVPIGLEHDTDYFSPLLAMLVDRTLGLPRAVSRIRNLDASRHVTLLSLLSLDDLALVSVWSPTFLTLLADELDRRWPILLDDLARGRIDPGVALPDDLRRELERALGRHPRRARELARAFGTDAPPTDLGLVWPGLALVSCWTDAQAARALPAMRRRVPNVRVQPKGLLATEGVTSIPWRGHDAPVLAVASHLIELLPLDSAHEHPTRDATVDGTLARSAHEVEPGMRAEVLLTTAGGLTRYRTFDLVECVGRARGSDTPLVRFVGRADFASDLAGEKLVPEAVEAALDDVGVPPGSFLAPHAEDPARYVLVLDAAGVADDARAVELAAAVDERLSRQHHYALCRELGQLGAVEPLRIASSAAAWERASLALGQRAGSRKDSALDPRPELVPLLRAELAAR